LSCHFVPALVPFSRKRLQYLSERPQQQWRNQITIQMGLQFKAV